MSKHEELVIKMIREDIEFTSDCLLVALSQMEEDHRVTKVFETLQRIKDAYVCDCGKSHGKDCLYPDKIQNGGV